MSITGWIIVIVGAVVGTTLFEIVFHWLFDSKRQMPKHLDFAYQSRIRWWEYSRILTKIHDFFH